MGKKKKGFINRKNALTFQLVHRSQHDPLITDEKAPQRVLIEAPLRQTIKETKEEQQRYGVLFDDDYDYLQHLKTVGEDKIWASVEIPNHERQNEKKKVTLQLPSSVFASKFQEEEGMLNKAAVTLGPRPEWDHEIVAGLEEDFDYNNPDNQLEDDFVVTAMGESVGAAPAEKEFDSHCFEHPVYDTDDLIAMGELNDQFSEIETKTQFTDYSISSCVIPRNEQLTFLDERFENFYSSYDKQEIGSRDFDDIDGFIDTSILIQCCKQSRKENALQYDKKWDKDRMNSLVHEMSNEEFISKEIDRKKMEDSASILTTNLNHYNHPKLIPEPYKTSKIKIDVKTGIPLDAFQGKYVNKLTPKSLLKFDEIESTGLICGKDVLNTMKVLSIRPEGETADEKSRRKRLLREYRAERRIEKKANTQAFNDEKKLQQKIKTNNACNVQRNRIV